MVKLNKKRIEWLVDKVINEGKNPKDIALVYNLSRRRVQQLASEFRKTKKYPDINKNRRPKIDLTSDQKKR